MAGTLKLINSTTSNPNKTNKYQDPLNKPIPVLMSYSNELGTAIYEIAPRLGTTLWAPSLMYLGADIYDKYKNDKDSYNPSGKRAFKRAVFQGMTSVIALPLLIFAGQCIVSPLAKMDKYGISGNAKDAVYKHTKSVIDQIPPEILDNYSKLKETIMLTLKNKIESRAHEKSNINIFKRLYYIFFTERYEVLSSKKDKVMIFAVDNAKNIFNIITGLKNNEKDKVPKNILSKYKKLLPEMKEMYHVADYSHNAAKAALKQYQSSLIFKNKLLKTLGGFGALILFAEPVNDFVEKYIMKKYINPGIDQINFNFVNESKLKNIFNDMKNNINHSYTDKRLTSNLIAKLKSPRESKSAAAESQ